MSARRDFLVLVFLILGQLILLSSQVRDWAAPNAVPQHSLLAGTALRVFGPALRASAGVDSFFGRVAADLQDRRRALTEVKRLEVEVDALRRRNIELEGARLQFDSLLMALGHQAEAVRRVVPAEVIYAEHRPWRSTIVVRVPQARGEQEQPVSGAPVMHQDGLVGRIIETAPPLARVQLITDRSSSVGVMIERTRRQAVLQGATGGEMQLEYVPLQEDVRPGDRLLTAGIDGVYPRGLTVGLVVSVEPGDEIFHDIRVAPTVDLSRLERVFLLPPEPPIGELLNGEEARAKR
jgi:rod shape-determining protein MreC